MESIFSKIREIVAMPIPKSYGYFKIWEAKQKKECFEIQQNRIQAYTRDNKKSHIKNKKLSPSSHMSSLSQQI